MRDRSMSLSGSSYSEVTAGAQPGIVGVVPDFPGTGMPLGRRMSTQSEGAEEALRWLELSPEIPAW